MNSYTYCSPEGVQAVTDALPDRYPMDLNRSDMERLVEALALAFEGGHDWSGDFLSSIATTVNVEFI